MRNKRSAFRYLRGAIPKLFGAIGTTISSSENHICGWKREEAKAEPLQMRYLLLLCRSRSLQSTWVGFAAGVKSYYLYPKSKSQCRPSYWIDRSKFAGRSKVIQGELNWEWWPGELPPSPSARFLPPPMRTR